MGQFFTQPFRTLKNEDKIALTTTPHGHFLICLDGINLVLTSTVKEGCHFIIQMKGLDRFSFIYDKKYLSVKNKETLEFALDVKDPGDSELFTVAYVNEKMCIKTCHGTYITATVDMKTKLDATPSELSLFSILYVANSLL